MIKQFEASESPRYLIADFKLYSEPNAANLAHHRFLTRIPGTLKIEHQLIAQAWQSGSWTDLEEGYRAQSVELCHYGIEQRWLILYSNAAWNRAESTLAKIVEKEGEATAKHLFHLQAKRFSCEQDARDALEKILQGCKYHRLAEVEVVEHIRYAKKGKPTADTPVRQLPQNNVPIAIYPSSIMGAALLELLHRCFKRAAPASSPLPAGSFQNSPPCAMFIFSQKTCAGNPL